MLVHIFDAFEKLVTLRRLDAVALHLQQREDRGVGRADVVRDEVQSLVALLQRPAYLRHVYQGDEPAHVGKLGEGLAQHEQAAPLRIVTFALGGNLSGQELIGAQQRLQGVGILQVLQHLEDGFALQRSLWLKRAQTHIAQGGDVGQEDAALCITDKVGGWQLLQAVAHKLVQIPQLARGGFHRVDAPFQEVAAPCP